jgi:hypothetical protein
MAFDFFANPAGKAAKRKSKSKSKKAKSKSGARKVASKRPKAAKKRVSHRKSASRRGKRRAPKRKVTRGIATLTGCKIKIRKARKGESFAHVLKKMPKAGRPKRRGAKRGRKTAMRSNPYNPFAAFLNPTPKKGAAKRGRPKKSKSKSRRTVSHGGVTVARVVKIEKGLAAANGRIRKVASHVTRLDHRTSNMNKIREAVGIPRLPTDMATQRGH